MTTFTKELDEILLDFANRVESIPRGKTYGWDEERKAILSLVSERIIGKDETTYKGNRYIRLGYRNELRAEQRTTLYEGTKEEKDNG